MNIGEKFRDAVKGYRLECSMCTQRVENVLDLAIHLRQSHGYSSAQKALKSVRVSCSAGNEVRVSFR